MVGEVLERFGRLDVAFANAGFGAKRGFLAETPEFWRSMVLTNVYGAALTIRATLEALKDAQGHLLLTGSVAGRRALPGLAVLGHQVGGDGDGRGRAPGAQRHRRAGDADRARAVDTPFFDNQPKTALVPEDVARAVMYAVSQPPHVDVNEILIRPTSQEG